MSKAKYLREKTMKKTSICVVVPVYKGQKYVDGIIKQIEISAEEINDRAEVELLFVNDAPDEQLTISYKPSNIKVTILYSDKNRGIHGARVFGLSQANSEYVLFLDQDDEINVHYFYEQLKYIKNYDAVVCGALHEGRPRYDIRRPISKVIEKQCMITEGNMIVSPGQVLVRRRAIPVIWEENILKNNGADDWFLWIAMMAQGKQFTINNQNLFCHNIQYQNTSFESEKMEKSEWEIYEILNQAKLLKQDELEKFEALLHRLRKEHIIEAEKCKSLFFVVNDWMKIHEKKKTVAQYLLNKGINTIDIYGFGHLGRHLLNELKNSDITVRYIMDENAEYLLSCEPVILPRNMEETPEIAVITLLCDDKLTLQLNEKLGEPVVCLKDIIYELSRDGENIWE